MKDGDITHIEDERKEDSLKLEVLDYYPDHQQISSLHYLQGIEKVCHPETDLFVIELKGHHIKPKTNPKKKADEKNSPKTLIHNNKTLSLLDPKLQRELTGQSIHRRCRDYSNQLSILNS